MSNGQLHDDKLFQGLHDRLSDYEAPYNGADWDAMSRELDKLPKSNNFRWKFSLNTIGIMLGIVGLTVVGVVLASGTDNKPRPAENTNTVTPPNNPVSTTTTNIQTPTVTQPAPTDVAVNSTIPANENFAGMNSHHNLSNPKRTEEKFDNPFRFGDQADPVKGWVKPTEEDPALLKGHTDMKQPDVYWELDENGKPKPIRINNADKDSIIDLETIEPQADPQPTTNEPEPTAPTEGQRTGFGDEEPK